MEKELVKKSAIISIAYTLAVMLVFYLIVDLFMEKECDCWDEYKLKYGLTKYSFDELNCTYECGEVELLSAEPQNPKLRLDDYKLPLK